MTKEVEVIINPEPMTMINFLVTKEFKRKLKMKALRNGESISEISRRLLEEYLNDPDTKTKRKRIKTKRVL